MGAVDGIEPYPVPPEEAASARASGQRVHPLTPLAKGLLYFAAVVGFVVNRLLDSKGRTSADWIQDGVLLGGLFLAGLLVGYLSWRSTRYLLAADALRVSTGWLVRSERTVTYARIQSVDVTAPFVARLMGLAGLRVDITGGEEPLKLEFLRPALAEELRARLIDTALEHRAAAGAPGAVAMAQERPAEPSVPAGGLPVAPGPDAGEPQRVLFTHGPGRIIGAGLISSALIWSLLGLAYAVVDMVVTGDGLRLASIVVLVGTFGPLWSFISGNWNLTVAETDRGLLVTRGLLSITRESVLPGRVVGVRISEPVLWRIRGLAKVELDVAQGGLMTPNPMVVVLAAGTRDEVASILRRLPPHDQILDADWHGSSPRARFVRPIGWRLAGYALTEDLACGRWGWFVRRTAGVLQGRLIAVATTAGPWQRRLGLRTVEASAALDHNIVKAPHLHAVVADELADRLLARLYAKR